MTLIGQFCLLDIHFTKVSFHVLSENGLKNHLIHPVCCWQTPERPPWVGESSGSLGEEFPDSVNNPLQLFLAAHLVDTFLSAEPHIMHLE